MTSPQPSRPDFSAPEVPLSVRITGAANAAIWAGLGSTRAALLWLPVLVVVVAVSLSPPLRSGRSTAAQVGIVALVSVGVILAAVLGATMSSTARYARLVDGRPRFDPLRSDGRRLLSTLGRCIASVELRFRPEDQLVTSRLGALSLEFAELAFHQTYRANRFDDADWPEAWQEIEGAQIGPVPFGEATRSGLLALFGLRHAVVTKLTEPLAGIFTAGYILLLSRAVANQSLLGLVQLVLAFGVVTAAVIFVNFTTQLRVITPVVDGTEALFAAELEKSRTDPEVAALLDEWRRRLDAEMAGAAGRDMLPTITIRPGYVEAIRSSFVRRFLIAGLADLVGLLPLLWLCSLAGLLLSAWTDAEVLGWAGWMTVGLVVAPFAFAAAVAFGFFLLARTRALLTLVATGLFLAVIPPLVSYAFGGETDATVIITSVVAGLAGILSSAVAELVKKRPSAEARVD